MVQYTLKQCAFPYELCVKYGSARKYRSTFCRTFLVTTVPSTRGIHELTKKVRSTQSLVDKKPARKLCVLIKEKLDKVRARLEHTLRKSLRRLI
jgi:hypothetical protein